MMRSRAIWAMRSQLFRERTRALQEVLGPKFCKLYDAVKEQEYSAFLQVISPWEREHLLMNV